jgi:MoaA/NifB/PqqE/SkfB family radical SAM enzyme
MQEHNVLDFVTKLLQPAAKPRVVEYVQTRTTSGPVIVEFDPTTTCNFSCPECISSGLLNKGQIAPGRTLELISEFQRAGVKGIIFVGGGEPLAHTGMPQPVIHAHELGLQVGLTTNGSLIERNLEAIAHCVNWTRVSIDAATPETFALFRPSYIPNAFRKVIANMEKLARSKTGLLGYSFLIMERSEPHGEMVTNSPEIFAAARLAREIGCDYFELKPMVNEHHHLLPFSTTTRELVTQQLERIHDLTTSTFRVIWPQSIDHLLHASSPDQPKTYTTCPTMELRTVVTPDGIYPCPYKRGLTANRLGGLDLPFDSFWPSDERKKRALQVNPSLDCSFYCIRHQTNILLTTLAQTYAEGVNLLDYLMTIEMTNDIFL